MATAQTATPFDQALSPKAELDYTVIITQAGVNDTGLGAGKYPMLQAGEQVASFTISPLASALAAGLQILDGGDATPRLSGLALTFWLQIDPSARSRAAFDGVGQMLGVELMITTDSTPPRTFQTIAAVQVARQKVAS